MSKHKPMAIWWTDELWLYVRFENVEYSYFDEVLSRFKESLPKNADWHPEVKAWRLPKTAMQGLALFVQEVFGDNSLYPRGDCFQLEFPSVKL